MNVCARRIETLSRWELRRFFQMGGLREVASCILLAAPIGFGSAMLGNADLLLVMVSVTPALSAVVALQSFIKEREGGILPALLSTPATAADLVLGKTIGYFLLGATLYWCAVLGASLGLYTGIVTRGAPLQQSVRIESLVMMAIVMTSVVMAVVGATVAICWHARTLRAAIFWSFAGVGIASAFAVVLNMIRHFFGAKVLAACVLTLDGITISMVILHASSLTTEPVLYRWVKKGRRKQPFKHSGPERPGG